MVGRWIGRSEAKAGCSVVRRSRSVLIQGHFVAIWNVSSENRSSGRLWSVIRCYLACRMILRLGGRQLIRDDIDYLGVIRLTRSLTTHFRISLVWLSPVHHRPILSSTAPRIPHACGRRNMILGARDVGVARQQVWRCNIKPSTASSTISRLMDWGRRLGALCAVK